ncbi:hypothetical protein BGZ76_007412 [Entomortierella beljakovae]|nr:hypothetical protein BGZ76_007412 [Entomortierella beljakovae]
MDVSPTAPGSMPGRGKNQRQSNSRRSGNDREQGRTANNYARSSPTTATSSTDSLVASMGQANLSDKSSRGNNKKNQVSLNHLLNFSFPVREEPQITGPIRRRRNANYQPFNKDRFINANFRFLLSPRRDYEIFTMDADVRVEWDDIEQVLISVPQSCPICLQPPVAARITKCGHVYCFPCILHYLALSDTGKAWRKCPICWDSIYEKDLKCVRTVQEEHDIYDQGEKEIAKQIASKQEVILEMKLIQRSINSTIALPRSKTFPLGNFVLPEEFKAQPPLEFYPDAMVFSRLMITTLDRIVSELDRDIRSIEFSMEEAKSFDPNSNSEEMVFYEVAMTKIQEAKTKIRDDSKFFPKTALNRERILRQYFDRASKEDLITVEEEVASSETSRIIAYAESGPEAYEVSQRTATPTLSQDSVTSSTIAESNTENDSDNQPSTAITSGTSQKRNPVPNQVTTTFYFYQASNGHHLYLQPLDIRILKQHFDLYEKFPDTIKVKVLGIEETSLTEEVRKKCKYLGHLPLGCEVSFLDVVLEDIVGEEGVKPFETELKLRRSKRHEKEAREERERIAREHKLNPPKPRRDDFFANDPFFQVPVVSNNSRNQGNSAERTNLGEIDADYQEALRISAQEVLDEMPTLSEANARLAQRPSVHTSSNPKVIQDSSSASGTGTHEPLTSSYESNSSGGHMGSSTIWGTPSVPVSRHYDDYDDYYEEEHDYEPDVVLKRGKKKVTVLMSNNSRRSR